LRIAQKAPRGRYSRFALENIKSETAFPIACQG